MLKTKKTMCDEMFVKTGKKRKGLQAQRTFFATFDMQGCVSDQIEPERACHCHPAPSYVVTCVTCLEVDQDHATMTK